MKNILSHIDDDSLELLRAAGTIAQEKRMGAYLVGGPVRDILLKAPLVDIDIVVEGKGMEVARSFAVAFGGKVVVYPAFKTATVTLPGGRQVDFATCRKERYVRPGAFPKVAPAKIEEDLKRRDFTVNAVAVAVDPAHWGTMIDPFGGVKDIGSKKIRVLHEKSFIDDPTRMLRAVRFKERFGFEMEKKTMRLLKEAVAGGAIKTITAQRYKKEHDKILKEPRSLAMLACLRTWGI